MCICALYIDIVNSLLSNSLLSNSLLSNSLLSNSLLSITIRILISIITRERERLKIDVERKIL